MAKRRKKTIVIGDTIYPHRGDSYAHDQWSSGHCHEDDPETTLAALLQKDKAAKVKS